MATASVELGDINSSKDNSFHGRCARQESLTISGSTATLATAVTQAEVTAGNKLCRVATDTACYWAIGSTPDPTATTATSATTARRLLPAGGSIEFILSQGEKVAVRAVS